MAGRTLLGKFPKPAVAGQQWHPGAESIQSVELVAAFEEEFDIDMDEEEALQVKGVHDAVTFIERCL